MPDLRRSYAGAGAGEPLPTDAKPAYLYDYRPGKTADRRRPPMEQFSVQQKQFGDDRRGTTRSPGSQRRPIEGKPVSSTIGDFRQEPDGTIVMVQPTAVDPYENRVKCVKFFIFGSNVVMLIVGMALLALGAYLKADDRFRDLLSENFRQVTSKSIDPVLYVGTYIIIAIALIMIIVSFFGCCGAILDHQCLLSTYFVFLILIFFLQVSVMALVLMKREKIENDVGEALDYMVQHYYQGPGMITDVMDMLQMTFRCCGNSGCADYSFLRMNVPRSCDTQCDGCRYRMFRFFRDGFTVISVAMALVFIAEILATGFSLYLCCFIRSHPTTRRRYFYYKPAGMSKPASATTVPTVGRTPAKKPL